MGFGFNLAFVFIVVPLTIILFVVWFATKKYIYGRLIGIIWACIVLLGALSVLVESYRAKIQLKKEDYYGSYIIDRNYFKGRQADWQYNTYRFEIKPNDSLYFYVTGSKKLAKIFKGSISTVTPYSSARLVLNMDSADYHILATNPTTYRHRRSFFLVFNSPVFGNMFFKKGDWIPLSK